MAECAEVATDVSCRDGVNKLSSSQQNRAGTTCQTNTLAPDFVMQENSHHQKFPMTTGTSQTGTSLGEAWSQLASNNPPTMIAGFELGEEKCLEGCLTEK